MPIKKFISRNRHAYATIRWFLSDFVLRYKYELIFVTIIGAASAALQTGILVGLNHLVGNGMHAELASWWAVEHASFQLGAALAVLLGLSACLAYFYSQRTLALWPRYQLHAIDTLYFAAHAAAQRGIIDKEALESSSFRKTLRGTQRLGALTRIVTRSILPAFRFLGFLGYAIFVNPLLTLALVLVVTPLSGASLLLFSRRAAQCDRAAEAKARDAGRDLDARTELYLAQGPLPTGLVETPDNAPVVIERIENLVARFLWAERSRLATGLITICMLGVVVASSGNGPDINFGQLVVYLLALILTFTQLAQLASTVSTVSRFYPTATRHRRMLEILSQATSKADFMGRVQAAGLIDVRDGNDNDDDLE